LDFCSAAIRRSHLFEELARERRLAEPPLTAGTSMTSIVTNEPAAAQIPVFVNGMWSPVLSGDVTATLQARLDPLDET
jgi:hypothetical protein